jgi:hypothetical protein
MAAGGIVDARVARYSHGSCPADRHDHHGTRSRQTRLPFQASGLTMPLNIHDYDDVTLDEIITYPEWLQEEIYKSMKDSMSPRQSGVLDIFEFADELLEHWKSTPKPER